MGKKQFHLHQSLQTLSSLSSLFILMSSASIAFRYPSLLRTSFLLPCTRLSTTHLTKLAFPRVSRNLTMVKDQSRGESTTGISEWKQRPPYRVHEDNDKFEVKHEASCHCGKVKYQLSRQEPLDSKLCHCTTCQTQHGMYYRPFLPIKNPPSPSLWKNQSI